MNGLDKRKLYRFPWSSNDSPTGWIEVTDYCNIECKGCYRQQMNGHKGLDEIKDEVLFLKRWRNIDGVSLAGGEPLIHPNIVDIVGYIRSQGKKAFILTNGENLDKNLLIELKQAGLTGFTIHIDMHQIRGEWTGKNEIELNDLRQTYADLLWDGGKIPCGFSLTVYRKNLNYIPDLIQWALSNRGKVQSFTFITYRGVLARGMDYSVGHKEVTIDSDSLGYATFEDPDEISIKSTEVYEIIRSRFPEFEASAYLGGTQSHTSFKWLLGLSICSGEKMLGSIGPRCMELNQIFYHLIHGTYMIKRSRMGLGRKIFFLAPFDRQIRRAFSRTISKPWHIFKQVYGLGFGIIQPPDALPDGRVDMCESCPDVTLYQGKLVSSCRLDEYRKFEDLLTPGSNKRTI